MNTSFTPGPWEIENRTKQGEFCITTHIVAKDKSHLAIITPCNIEANARLIASSPDLLSALQEMYSMFCAHEQYDDDSAAAVKLARSAINLATGQKP
jgi:hypothetical protein